MSNAVRPGSSGEHELQEQYGTRDRADRFYAHQVLDRLNEQMQIFTGRQEMLFIATADAHGECDASFRAGPPGFIRVLDAKTVTWPEYRGNGVMASMGNIRENGHVGLLMMDFFKDMVGLHVNGSARVVEDDQMQVDHPWLMEEDAGGRRPERWIVVDVEEAYIHCSKHIPRMMRVRGRQSVNLNRAEDRKGADFFRARSTPSPWQGLLDQPGAPDGLQSDAFAQPSAETAQKPFAETQEPFAKTPETAPDGAHVATPPNQLDETGEETPAAAAVAQEPSAAQPQSSKDRTAPSVPAPVVNLFDPPAGQAAAARSLRSSRPSSPGVDATDAPATDAPATSTPATGAEGSREDPAPLVRFAVDVQRRFGRHSPGKHARNAQPYERADRG